MDSGILPENGMAQVGPVALPVDQRVYAEKGELVAWVTAERLADTGAIWSQLSGACAETGLTRITLARPQRVDAAATGVCGEDFGFWFPADVSALESSQIRQLAAQYHLS